MRNTIAAECKVVMECNWPASANLPCRPGLPYTVLLCPRSLGSNVLPLIDPFHPDRCTMPSPLPPFLAELLARHDPAEAVAALASHPAGLALAVIGLGLAVAAVLRAVLGGASFLYANFLRPGTYLQRHGSWAVVTGGGVAREGGPASSRQTAGQGRRGAVRCDPLRARKAEACTPDSSACAVCCPLQRPTASARPTAQRWPRRVRTPASAAAKLLGTCRPAPLSTPLPSATS